MPQGAKKQNVTVSLRPETIRKARILAARQSTSISQLLADQIETLTGEDEAYEQSRRSALALLDHGLRLGGKISYTREQLHER
ncbi:MAG TPA: hypothetical protein VIY53_00665 [Acidobacteriaceae bacterium]